MEIKKYKFSKKINASLFVLFSFLLFFGLNPLTNKYVFACAGDYYCSPGGCGGKVWESNPYKCCSEYSCWCCGGQVKRATCKLWQKCTAKKGSYSCPCDGPSCVATPINPRYYDNPTYSDQADKSKDSINIYLPVKLDWDDVAGWGQTDGPQSYVTRIEKPSGDYLKTVNKSDYNYRDDSGAGSCFLQSDSSYDWHVKACCAADGTNCGGESDWNFTTSPAPEPISPVDPDWTGSATVPNIPLDFALKWCPSDYHYDWEGKPLGYRLKLYEVKSTGEVCHPLTGCETKLLSYYPDIGYPPAYASNTEYNLFTKNTDYAWQVEACKDGAGNDCTDFSQKWIFSTIGTLEKPTLTGPPNDPAGVKAVGLPVLLKWFGKLGSASFAYTTSTAGLAPTYEGKTRAPNASLNYPSIVLETLYKWRVKPCWDLDGNNCETSAWSDYFYFKTTGAPPGLSSPGTAAVDIPIPAKLDWEDISGANSYKYEVASDSGFTNITAQGKTENSEVSADYPNLKMLTDYWWRVKTCADKDGSVCGNWSSVSSFKTFKLNSPSNPSPTDTSQIFTYQGPQNLSWNAVPGAKYYKIVLNYVSKAADESSPCPTGNIFDKTVSNNNSGIFTLSCLGSYQWQAVACLDGDCLEAGDLSPSWSFTFSQSAAFGKGGLVPCGSFYDNPDTPYPQNEREPCQIKHLFLIIKNVLDFILWQVGPIILVLLAMLTAVIFYFAMGAPEALVKTKTIWKVAGIGYLIIFSAWAIINIFLALLGYQTGIFGNWWQIKF